MCLSCSWSAPWWWRTGTTSWTRASCRTGRRRWLPSWPTLSPRSSPPSVVSLTESSPKNKKSSHPLLPPRWWWTKTFLELHSIVRSGVIQVSQSSQIPNWFVKRSFTPSVCVLTSLARSSEKISAYKWVQMDLRASADLDYTGRAVRSHFIFCFCVSYILNQVSSYFSF